MNRNLIALIVSTGLLISASIIQPATATTAERPSAWRLPQGLAPARVNVRPLTFIEDQFFSLPTSWKGIIPLKTMRAEVEIILGKSISSGFSRETYQASDARINVWYSTGPCHPVVGRWNVSAGIVVAVDVSLKRPLLLSNLEFDRHNYVRTEWSHPEDWVSYLNRKDGIEITTINLGEKAELIQTISYRPKVSDNVLRCHRR
jgi:hypothetical protein